MNRIKASYILLTLFVIACLFPLKTEAALHISMDPQTFRDSYNFWVEEHNQRKIGEPIPLIEELTLTEYKGGSGYEGFFDDNLPDGRIFIAVDNYGRMESIWIAKHIDGYKQHKGRNIPEDLFTFNEIAAYMLSTLEYPTNTKAYRQKLADTITDMFYNYDKRKKFSLYNPVTEVTYLLYYRVNEINRFENDLVLYIREPINGL